MVARMRYSPRLANLFQCSTLAAEALILACFAGCGGKSTQQNTAETGNPAVVVDAKGLSFGGKHLADPPADKLERIEPLFLELKELRESSKASSPQATPPTELDIRLPADTTCSAALSVLHSAALAGRTEIALSVGDEQHQLSIYIPGLPDFSSTQANLVAKFAPGLSFTKEGKVAVSKNPCAAAYDNVAADQIPATIAELASGAKFDRLVVTCEPGVAMKTVLASFQAASKLPERGAKPLQISAKACHNGNREWPALMDPKILTQVAGDPDAPTAPWGREDSLGQDPTRPTPPSTDALDDVITPPPDRKSNGRLGMSIKDANARIREIKLKELSTGLTVEDVTKSVNASMDRIASCYYRGLQSNPNLNGRVTVDVEVGKLGTIISAAAAGDLPDSSVIGCITRVTAKRVVFSPAPTKLTHIGIVLYFAPG